jgi:lipopolysaccharide/colanic/teichoic acid biosynthesis glycosyltransferase
VFYTSLRAGQGFKIFDFYKFRTMEVDADKKIEALAHLNQYTTGDTGPLFFKVTNDPRITRFGQFLRNTSMDELPQLFNVIKGDMSLVGNRPLPLYEAATLTTNEFVERFMAPAGITGLWQVKKRGKAEMSIEERINLDILYARRSNLLYDLRIMASTPAALWQKTNV